MKRGSTEAFAAFVGLDWAEAQHEVDVAILCRTHGDTDKRSAGEGWTMRKPAMQGYRAACKERAVKRAVASEQPSAQTARDLGVHDNTRPTWLGTYHRAARQEPPVKAEPRDEDLQRLRQEHARGKAERTSLTKAAASCAQPLPCSTPGAESRRRRCRAVVWVGYWRGRVVVPMSGGGVRRAPPLTLSSRGRPQWSTIVPRGVAPTAHGASRLWGCRTDARSAAVASGAYWPRRADGAKHAAHAQRRRPQATPRPWRQTSSSERGLGQFPLRATAEICPLCIQAQAGWTSRCDWRGARGRAVGGPGLTTGGRPASRRRSLWHSARVTRQEG
jgi:transposase-like protein